MKISQKAKNAIRLGALCSISYLAVYIARNVLSTVTPDMLEDGFTEEFIGSASSLYFITYAVGQLINGVLGDKISPKYMISFGLLLAGITNFTFSIITQYRYGAMIVYAMTGFFLSMIYGPMTKVVSENTEPKFATRCSLGYTFASFIGSPAAGMLATFMVWQSVFFTSSLILTLMAVCFFLFYALFEKRGIISKSTYKPKEKVVGNVKVLFKRQIVKYSIISILTGVVRTSVVFWLPTYLAQYLNYETSVATSLFSISTLIISFTAFIAVFIYERITRDLDKTVLVMFISAFIFFTLTYLIKHPIINIVFIILSIMSSNGAASMLWSRYCPSLYDTGMVSTATGFLDFLSYMAAALANVLFANAVTSIGWENLILVWVGLMVIGIIVALPYNKIFRNKSKTDNTIVDKSTSANSDPTLQGESTICEDESNNITSLSKN